MKENLKDYRIGIVGLGYVGLPLAIEFGKKFAVTGFDIDSKRINELLNGQDHTLEAPAEILKQVIRPIDGESGVFFTSVEDELKKCNVFIITVPTPVDIYNNPDLTYLLDASTLVAKAIKKDDIIIYESTVYPGCTEEQCVPVLEKYSGLTYNVDFFCGYSPERINPSDKTRMLPDIKKVTSGSTFEASKTIDELYQSIITAGTYLAPSIKVAEAAKVIENAQRDINIAFVNELAKIFALLNIDTHEVLKAASTKWNFLPFKPGLVGGHCIGVDPFYLAQKATSTGYHPEIILSGRRINDSMGTYVADTVVKLMLKKKINIWNSDVLILGITFKENCPDIRNTKVVDIIKSLQQYECKMTVYDPWANCEQVKELYGITCFNHIPLEQTYDAVILAVSHQEFTDRDYSLLLKPISVLYDVKGVLNPEVIDGRL